jgi:hypothetical protein
MQAVRQVDVSRQDSEISYINREGREQVLGTVGLENFEGEGIRKVVFQPAISNPFSDEARKSGQYELGMAKSAVEVINPADIQRVIVDQGWQPQYVYAGSGGTDMQALYVDKDRRLVDSIDYDLDVWGSAQRGDVGYLYPAVQVSTNLYIGRMSAEVQVGIYRVWCRNGAAGFDSSLPQYKFKHSDWDISKIRDVLSGQMALPRVRSLPEGKEMCSPQGLAKAIDFLMRYQDAVQEGKTEKYSAFEKTFQPLRSDAMSVGMTDLYTKHLMYAAMGRLGQTVNAVHLINAFTSAANEYNPAEDNRGMLALVRPMMRVVEATASLAQMAEVFVN